MGVTAGVHDWEPQLAELLQSFERPLEETGAELEIAWPDGERTVWPLARHYRIEVSDGSTLLWLRPITGGYDHEPGAPARAFSLSQTRPHAFPTDGLHHEGDVLVGRRPHGVRYTIRPVSGERRAELDAWDTFCYVYLDDDEFEALAELREDSWHGQWA